MDAFLLPTDRTALLKRLSERMAPHGDMLAGLSPSAKGADLQRVWGETAPTEGQPLMLYVHVPFCVSRCAFCGFYAHRTDEVALEAYTGRLLREIAREADRGAFTAKPVDVVYFGGGTPTALSAEQLRRVIGAIYERFNVAPDVEFTVEGRIYGFDDERVRVLSAPAGLKASTIGALEDFATGVRDADALLGQLVSYFSQVDEPVILVFWGDHYNPIDSGYDVYTQTGYASADSSDPALHQTTLLMWSNYSNAQVDLGTIAAYEVSPVMMDVFGLEQPLYFQYLNRQLRYGYRSCTGGKTILWNGTVADSLTPQQERWRNNHWLLQYDLMFGEGYALDRMGISLEENG